MSRPPIRIRVAKTAADFDVIATMQRVCLPVDDLVDPRQGTWLVARTAKGVAVGFSGGYLYKNADGTESAFVISRQGVIPAMTGLRLQQRMIAEHEKQCAASGIAEIWTYTATHNLASGNSFIARGFRMWAPRYWDDKGRVLEPGVAQPPNLMQFTYWRKRVIK